MTTNLSHLTSKISELEGLGDDILALATKLSKGDTSVQPDLSLKGQKWYRGARAILVAHKFSGLDDFDRCYDSTHERPGLSRRRSFTDIEQFIDKGTNTYHNQNLWSSEAQGIEYLGLFTQYFQKARALLRSVVDEILARELPVKTDLSFEVSASEFETAGNILAAAKGAEPLVRAAGVVARVALERHLLTVAESHGLTIQLNPAHKPKHDTNDILTTLQKGGLINPIQRSELETHFKVGNNCAHPKEVVDAKDVDRLIVRGRELAASVL